MTVRTQEVGLHLRMVDGDFVAGNPELDASWQRAQEQCLTLTGSGLEKWENLGYRREHIIEAVDQLVGTMGQATKDFYASPDLTDAQRAEALSTVGHMQETYNPLFETANERLLEQASHSVTPEVTELSAKEYQQIHIMNSLYVAAQPNLAKAMVDAERIQVQASVRALNPKERQDYATSVQRLGVVLSKDPADMPKLPAPQPVVREAQSPTVTSLRESIHFNPTKTVATTVAAATLFGLNAGAAAAVENSNAGRSGTRDAAVVQTVDASIARAKQELFPGKQQTAGSTSATTQAETVSITLGDSTVQVETLPYDTTTTPDVVPIPYDTTSPSEAIPLPYETPVGKQAADTVPLTPAQTDAPEATALPFANVDPDNVLPTPDTSTPTEPEAANTSAEAVDTIPVEATTLPESTAETPSLVATPVESSAVSSGSEDSGVTSQQDMHPRTRRDNDRRAKEVEATLKPELVTLIGNLSAAAETGDPRKILPSLTETQATDPEVKNVVEILAAVTKGLIAGDPDAIALHENLSLDPVTEGLAAQANLTADGAAELPPAVKGGIAHTVMTLADITIETDQEGTPAPQEEAVPPTPEEPTLPEAPITPPEEQPAPSAPEVLAEPSVPTPPTPEVPAEPELPAGVISSERTPEGHAQLTNKALLPDWDITLKTIDGALQSGNLRDVGLPDPEEEGLKPIPITDSMKEKLKRYQKVFDKILAGDADAIAQFDESRIKDYEDTLEQKLNDTENPIHIVKSGDGYIELSKDQTKAFLANYLELTDYVSKQMPTEEPQPVTPPAEEAPDQEAPPEDGEQGEDDSSEYRGNTTNEGEPVPERLRSEGYNIRYFSQWDKRWANEEYSSVDNPKQTIASSGCAPTSMAMVASSLLGEDILPTEVAQYNLDNGYRTPDDGTDHAAFEPFAENKGLNMESVSRDIESIKKFFEQNMKDGKQGYIIASGDDTIPETPFTSSGHFIVIYGVSAEGNLLVADPNNVAKSTEATDIGWDKARILPYVGGFFNGFTVD